MKIHHLKVKIYIGFLLLLAMMIAGTYATYRNLKEMNMFLQEMYEEHYISSVLAANLKAKISDVRTQLVNMSDEADEKYRSRFKEISKEIDDDIARWFKGDIKVRDEKMNVLLKDIQSTWNEFKNINNKQLIPFIYEDKLLETESISTILDLQMGRYKKMLEDANEVLKMEEAEANYLIDVSKKRFEKLIITTIMITLITIIIYLTASYYTLQKDLSKPITELTDHARQMAQGDISRDITVAAKSEIGDFAAVMNAAVKGMRNIIFRTRELSSNIDMAVKNISDSAYSIKNGAGQQTQAMNDVSISVEGLHKTARDNVNGTEQLLKLSEEISASTLEMAASIEEVDKNVADLTVAVGDTSISIEEIASSLKEVAGGVDNISVGADETASSLVQIDASAMEIERHTRECAELSDDVAKEGERGVKAVDLTHTGMQKIKKQVNALAVIIVELGQKSKEIGKILNVIDDVAIETNLLALNATILAAQAGEYGKGFSVVADEIRELSERTGASTREITDIISGIQAHIEKAVISVEEGMTSVGEGERFSVETTTILEGITRRFKTFQDMSLKIAKATQEQARGSKQVTQRLEANTATIHQMAMAIQEQSDGSNKIVQAVELMRESVSHMKKATTEQAKGSKIIAANTENMIKSIQKINVISSDQEKTSQQIAAAVVETAAVAGAGMENAKQLEDVVGMLTKDISILKQELERFKL